MNKSIDFTVRRKKAHRTNKEKRKRTGKQKYLTQGNDKADEFRSWELRLSVGYAEAVTTGAQMRRENIYRTLTCAVTFHEKFEAWDDMDEVNNIEKPKCVCVSRRKKRK